MSTKIKITISKHILFGKNFSLRHVYDIDFNSHFITVKNPRWTCLRSHEIDPWVILTKCTPKLNIPSYAAINQSIYAIIVICTTVRWILRVVTKAEKNFMEILLDTWGMLLSISTNTINSRLYIYSRAERLLNLTISFVSILTTRLLTIVLLNYLLAERIDNGIDTLNELAKIDQQIYINDEMKLTMNEWSQNVE